MRTPARTKPTMAGRAAVQPTRHVGRGTGPLCLGSQRDATAGQLHPALHLRDREEGLRFDREAYEQPPKRIAPAQVAHYPSMKGKDPNHARTDAGLH